MSWLQLSNPDSVASPGLVVDADRVVANIGQMVDLVGGRQHVGRLRPHVKTHKMPEVIRLQREAGITKFKTATLAEAEMVASVGPADILLAYQPVGPNLDRLFESISRYPDSQFSAITDDPAVVQRIAERFAGRSDPLPLWIDVDCGMHRTGIPWGDRMEHLRDVIEQESAVRFAGLHVYDGHIHDRSPGERQRRARQIIQAVQEYQSRRPAEAVVAGGSPTFASWAQETEWQCSPGTPLLWDVGYGSAHPDLPFQVAAAVLTRVISKPATGRLCLDLGYKAIAAEMPLDQRVVIPDLPNMQLLSQSEEHLVVATPDCERFTIGDALLAYPRHICPTVALHAAASVLRGGRASGETWRVTARDR